MGCVDFLIYSLSALLIRAGADVNVQDNQGKLAIAHLPVILREVPAYQDRKRMKRFLKLCQLPEVQAYLKDPLAFATIHKEEYFIGKITALMLACIFCHEEVISFYKDCSVNTLI